MAKTLSYFNILCRNILQQPQRLKRGIPAFAHHDVVVELDAQLIAGFPQVLGHVDVCFWLNPAVLAPSPKCLDLGYKRKGNVGFFELGDLMSVKVAN